MITREELSFFAKFCQTKYQVDVNFDMVEEFLQTLGAENVYTTGDAAGMEQGLITSCSSNNIHCTHITFHSAKCDECPF